MNINDITQAAEYNGYTAIMSKLDGMAFRKGSMIVIVSIAEERDGETWLHVSVSRPNKYPTYEELKRVKEIFVGADRDAIQIFPKKRDHVNIHNYCFHLFSCLNRNGILPDFTHGTGSI